MTPSGRKEVGEAVLIAGLCALATGLVNWGPEAAKAKVKEQQGGRKPPAAKKEDEEEKKP